MWSYKIKANKKQMSLTKIIVCVLWAIFGWSLYLSQDTTPHINVLLSMGALQRHGFYFEQLLYAGFLHANFVHILFNTLALNSVGLYVEKIKGHLGMLIIFLAGIIGGSACSLFFQTDYHAVSVGASSGIMALFMTLFVESVKQRNTYLMRQLLFTIVIALVPIIPHVDYSGHLGGAIIGVVLGLLI